MTGGITDCGYGGMMVEEERARVGKTHKETLKIMREALKEGPRNIDEWATWGLIVSYETEEHSARLVLLTWSLIALTAILSVLTGLLVYRTFIP
jgi:hypothetical protein